MEEVEVRGAWLGFDLAFSWVQSLKLVLEVFLEAY